MVIGWNHVSNEQSTTRFHEKQTVNAHVIHSKSVFVDFLNNQVIDDHLHLHSIWNYGTTFDGDSCNFISNKTPITNKWKLYMGLSSCPLPITLDGSESKQVTFSCSNGV